MAPAFACIKRLLSMICSISDCSRSRFRSASQPVTPNHLVRNSIGVCPSSTHHTLEMKLTALMLGRKQYADAFVLTKLENPDTLIGEAPLACGITKILSEGS